MPYDWSWLAVVTIPVFWVVTQYRLVDHLEHYGGAFKTLKMEEAGSSGTLVNLWQTTL